MMAPMVSSDPATAATMVVVVAERGDRRAVATSPAAPSATSGSHVVTGNRSTAAESLDRKAVLVKKVGGPYTGKALTAARTAMAGHTGQRSRRSSWSTTTPVATTSGPAAMG